MTTIEDKEPNPVFEGKWQKFVNEFLENPANEKIINAYHYGNLMHPNNRNVIEHQLMARVVVDVLCDLYGVTGQAKDDAVTAASLHDFNVLEEKAGRRNGKFKHYLDMEPLKEADRNKLRKFGFPEAVVELTDDNITHEDGGPKKLTPMFIFLADACISGTKIVDIPKRFEQTRMGFRSDTGKYDEKTAEENVYYYDRFWEGAPGHNSLPHDTVQLETARTICMELVGKLKESGSEDLHNPKYSGIFASNADPFKFVGLIRDKVEDRIISF